MAEQRTKWAPRELHLRLLKVFQEHDYAVSVSAACTEAKIGRQTYYDWYDDPEFVTWWEEQNERFFALGLSEVSAEMHKAATTGASKASVAAQKLYLERFDHKYMPKTRTEIDATVSIESLVESLGNDDNDEGETHEQSGHAVQDGGGDSGPAEDVGG